MLPGLKRPAIRLEGAGLQAFCMKLYFIPGAAKTSAYYAIAPFIGVLLSFIIFREIPGPLFFIALAIMIAGTWMVKREDPDTSSPW